MTSRLIRILAGLALMIAASQASAQSGTYGVEYRWLTLFGNVEHSVPELQQPGYRPQSTIEKVLGRAFLALESDYRLPESGYSTEYFRQPDPQFGMPAAFQRPRQARLSFRLRF
ncbi:MAG: hypothetical protein OEQ30_09235 [Gammaproteobacteria bacterium]|jgi:hypothetical protein|nr:hypothetical protein [Gammaproteobacteria bacterium]MDH3759191.1 hypothetical protein [Gammaproteobacteria bacterium]MDH3862888.1 hypothetical protein [Gammaproteobacteria bacterium]MDH3906448.1 hypothetical protein [Gammaproteobacteria bacterium]MDH4003476.1 hypothetical protein [Gammaproteobacteria bacterium]